ncbi:MAG: Ppx/GppA family phosphatase [Gammaproteobacteria bacterium]|nr:Ppx/GppA family phosphatase [Gammaproteobacteria bacterium]
MGVLATIDLGSNSFHCWVFKVEKCKGLELIFKEKYQVQLRAGLNEKGELNADAQSYALTCLKRFADQLRLLKPDAIDVVGTYTLRTAKNISSFLENAESILGSKIRIISGLEEARLIYLGVVASEPLVGRHLVIDIGGGSTEIILGESSQILHSVSLPMGCVGFQHEFFKRSADFDHAFEAALEAARSLLKPQIRYFLPKTWGECIGTSGTIQALFNVMKQRFSEKTLTLHHLQAFAAEIKKRGLQGFEKDGILPERVQLLSGGLAILMALFEQLGIDELRTSKSALREGVLHELIQKTYPECRDIQE